MSDLPLHAIPVIINDQIWLRIYSGRQLKLELPLRQRQALVLAAQLLNIALLPGSTGADALVLQTPDQQRVTNRVHGTESSQ